MSTVLATVHLDTAGVACILLAGLAAGTINSIVGSGSLITFPTLLALGYSPVVANVSNTVGLAFGNLSGAVGYRRELTGQRRRLLHLGIVAVAGGVTGSVLLLTLPSSVFRDVVPGLIVFACVLVVLQPRLSALLARRERHPVHGGPALLLGVFATGIYGGYFGAAQGVILLALLGIFLSEDLQRLNGVKNVLVMLVNAIAAIVFVIVAHVSWEASGLIAVSSIVGGQLGAAFGRKLSPTLLRSFVVVVGVIASIRLIA
jgi:uncharacterized membrane protein YfcA